jgi:hypothetical protein
VSTVHQASATRHCYTPDAADGAVDPVFLKPIGGQCVANLVGIFLFCSLARDHAATAPPHKPHPSKLRQCAMPSIDRTPESPLDAQVWVSSATDLELQGRIDSRSQYAGRILCVDSVLLAGHGVVVCVVGTELCWQLHCVLPKG